MDWTRLLSMVEQPLVIDGRNTFIPEEICRNGFRYVSIGRVDALPSPPAAEKASPSSLRADNSVYEVPA